MRNLLLILLLANILYFLWGWLGRSEEPPGVAIIDEAELGPPLAVRETPDAETVASVGAVLGEGEGTELVALVGRACVTVGPFRDKDDADEAQTRYAAEGMETRIRSGMGEYFIGHWVQIPDVPDRDTSNRMTSELRDGGLTDAYPVFTDDEGIKISLGLFGNRASAEKIRSDARALGFDAIIAPRTGEGELHWVDIGLPPGRGAAGIVERYGEDMVALHDDATCP